MSGIIRGNTTIGTPQTINTYVGGIFSEYTLNPELKCNAFISLKSTAYPDSSFNPNGSYFTGNTPDSVNSIAVQSDEKILVGGSFIRYTTNNQTYQVSNLVRLNTDGSLDSPYTGASSSFNGDINTVAIDYLGRAVVGGGFKDYNGNRYYRMARFSSDTTLDTTFPDPDFDGDVNVIVPTPYHTIEVGTGYTYLVGGLFSGLMAELDYNGGIVGGQVFNSVLVGLSVNAIALNTIALHDSEILNSQYIVYVGGNFSASTDGGRFNNMIALDSSGRILGNDFNINISGGTRGFNGPVYAIVVDGNGKILVGGNFTQYNGNSINYMVRLLIDGRIDESFSAGTGFNGPVYSIELDCCGKVLVGGAFTIYNSVVSRRIIRLLPNGNVDSTFAIGDGGFNNDVNAIYYSKS